MRDSTVYCWGNDDDGQLGDGVHLPVPDAGVDDRHAPQKLVGVTATYVAAGFAHACFFGGSSYECWGSNGYGELGHTPGLMNDVYLGALFANYGNSTPIVGASLPGTNTVASLGVDFSCANDTDTDNIFCWGANLSGQLGQGDAGTGFQPTPSPLPVDNSPGGLLGASKEVAAGIFHACALDAMGNASCWGSSGAGQLGTTAPVQANDYSYAITVMSGVAHISAGFFTTCVIDANEHIQCWGGNAQGQLGYDPATNPLQMCPDNSAPCSPIASTINVGGSPFGPAKALSLGPGSACAVKTDGTVWCWGATGAPGANDAGIALEPQMVAGLP
jgi:alpha-tubulin suppressor-like RCC1 family protein